MALTLTIAGNNFLPKYVTGTARIRELIQNKGNVLDMKIRVKTGEASPQEGSEIVFKDGARFLFGGYVSRIEPEEVGEGQLLIYSLEATDYSYIFNNKIVRRAYTNETLGDIVLDIMDTYVDASYGFDTTNVATGALISSVSFDHISVRKAFEKLTKLTGYVWRVDYEQKLYFMANTATPAGETITDATNNFESVSVAYDAAQVRNSVIVIGSEDGEQSLSTSTENFTGDGETRSWELEDKPSQVVSIKLNGVAQQYSLDLNERDTDIFTYSFSTKRLQLTFSQVAPGIGDDIEITYYPRIPIIVQKQDAASIAFFAAIDSGDGVYEYTIRDASVSSKAEATDRATQELINFADPLVNGEFITRTGLLAGTIFAPGQAVTVTLAAYGLTAVDFLIQEVGIQIIENTGNPEYRYTVRFGGRLAGVQEFLESLASEVDAPLETTEIKTLEFVSDIVVLDETAPSHTLTTPPFKWGSGGSPQGVWNESEYV